MPPTLIAINATYWCIVFYCPRIVPPEGAVNAHFCLRGGVSFTTTQTRQEVQKRSRHLHSHIDRLGIELGSSSDHRLVSWQPCRFTASLTPPPPLVRCCLLSEATRARPPCLMINIMPGGSLWGCREVRGSPKRDTFENDLARAHAFARACR